MTKSKTKELLNDLIDEYRYGNAKRRFKAEDGVTYYIYFLDSCWYMYIDNPSAPLSYLDNNEEYPESRIDELVELIDGIAPFEQWEQQESDWAI